MENYRIFLVEDDATIGRTVAAYLKGCGYEVIRADDFQKVDQQFAACRPHLVIMDIGLPFYNGYHWCAAIRAESKVPVLFLSSASDNLNQITALEMGGDDFVAKPFDLGFLTAKIGALLRRSYDFSEPAAVLTAGAVSLNLAEGCLTTGGQTVELTKNEIRILEMLMRQPGHVVTRTALMEKLWASDEYIDDNTLTVNINRLRAKLAAVGQSDFIKTRKGLGYSTG